MKRQKIKKKKKDSHFAVVLNSYTEKEKESVYLWDLFVFII